MLAIVKTKSGPGIEILDVEDPKKNPAEALVRVEAVGICGSDIHIYEWSPGYEHMTKYLPLIMGHEFSGEIVELRGGEEKPFKPGDKVTSETGKTCGQCFFCKQGKSVMCPLRLSYGRIGLERPGAMTSYVTVPIECLHRIPSSVSMEEAAMTEPAAVALGAAERACFFPGDTIVILGPGPIGLLILQMCRALGAGRIIVIGLESDAKRLDVASSLGADEILVGASEKTIQQVMSFTDGLGASVVFESSGAAAAAVSGLHMLRKTGELILVGIYAKNIPLDATHQLVRSMRTIKGAYGAASLDWDRVLNLAATKRIKLAPLISDVMPLEKAQNAFEIACRREGLKVILKP